jgi:PhzF family phenazine biosynthesis protein
MNLPVYQVDAFTDRPFSGNPAAVCLLDDERDDRWMQEVAAEMNLSETAFLLSKPDGYDLRWFTPKVEVDFCGHATLASAHVLWETGRLPPELPARFSTRSGLLTAVRRGEWIELDAPADPPQPTAPPAGLIEALGVEPRYVGRGRFDYLVEVDSEALLRGMAPDLARLATVETRGIIVTCAAGPTSGGTHLPHNDFLSRFFAPAAGIDEDPVTGSAHCCLGPFWGARLGKSELQGFQASQRGGWVRMRLEGERVALLGQAVTVLRGELTV